MSPVPLLWLGACKLPNKLSRVSAAATYNGAAPPSIPTASCSAWPGTDPATWNSSLTVQLPSYP